MNATLYAPPANSNAADKTSVNHKSGTNASATHSGVAKNIGQKIT